MSLKLSLITLLHIQAYIKMRMRHDLITSFHNEVKLESQTFNISLKHSSLYSIYHFNTI